MKITHLTIPDVLLIEPKIFEDERGYFFESFNQKQFNEMTGLDVAFVQDNQSLSHRGILRGLHYQLSPMAQGKLVRVIHGEVFDVAVDLRRDSSTFGQWVSKILSADNKYQLWIPVGFGHGFMTLSDRAELLYKTTNYYAFQYERCIIWNDPDLAIQWPSHQVSPSLSTKDIQGIKFKEAEVFTG